MDLDMYGYKNQDAWPDLDFERHLCYCSWDPGGMSLNAEIYLGTESK